MDSLKVKSKLDEVIVVSVTNDLAIKEYRFAFFNRKKEPRPLLIETLTHKLGSSSATYRNAGRTGKPWIISKI